MSPIWVPNPNSALCRAWVVLEDRAKVGAWGGLDCCETGSHRAVSKENRSQISTAGRDDARNSVRDNDCIAVEIVIVRIVVKVPGTAQTQ